MNFEAEVAKLEKELDREREAKKTAAAKEDYVQAESHKKHELKLEKELKELQERRKNEKGLGPSQDTRSSADPIFRQSLYMGSIDSLLRCDIIEVLRSACIVQVKCMPEKPSCSQAAQAARDLLADDPYNVKKICKLGLVYSSEGMWKHAMNVLLRGWKRVGELTEKRMRVLYLMKLCEASYRQAKIRQAHAVLQDIEEPDDRNDLKSYQILAIRVLAANGEVQQALQMFTKAVEGEDIQLAARILAAVIEELQKAGIYAAAKPLVERIAEEQLPKRFPGVPSGRADAYCSELNMLEAYSDSLRKAAEGSKDKRPGQWMPDQTAVVITACILMICIILYWLEQKSLSRLGIPTS